MDTSSHWEMVPSENSCQQIVQTRAVGSMAIISQRGRRKSQGCVIGTMLTFSDACDSLILIAIRFLEGVENIDLRPVGEHFADHRCLSAILLSELGEVALVVEGTGCRIVRLRVTVGPATTSASESASSTACRAPTASGGGPRCDLGHGVVFILVVGRSCEERGGSRQLSSLGERRARWRERHGGAEPAVTQENVGNGSGWELRRWNAMERSDRGRAQRCAGMNRSKREALSARFSPKAEMMVEGLRLRRF